METNEKIIAIVGITEAIKQYGVPSKFCPTIAIIIGILLEYAESNTPEAILKGIVLGATVTGGYAVTKRVGQGAISPFQKTSTNNLEPDDYRGI